MGNQTEQHDDRPDRQSPLTSPVPRSRPAEKEEPGDGRGAHGDDNESLPEGSTRSPEAIPTQRREEEELDSKRDKDDKTGSVERPAKDNDV